MGQTSQKGEARRNAILKDARCSLLFSGYAGLSLREISKQVNISLGNLQYYFPTKDDLVAAIIQEEVDDSLELLDEIDWTPDTRKECVRIAVSKLMHRLSGAPGQLYLIAGFLALNDTRFRDLHVRGYGQVFQSVGNAIAHLAPHLDATAKHNLTQVIVALFDGSVLRIQGYRGKKRAEMERLIDNISATILKLIDGH